MIGARGGKGAYALSVAFNCLNLPLVRLMEEPNYKTRLASLAGASCAGDVNTSKLSSRLICYGGPLKTPFWISNFGIRPKTLGSEVWMHTSQSLPVFAGWQNADLYAILPLLLLQACVRVSSC